MSKDKYEIEKFDGEDFAFWRLQVEDLLYSKGLHVPLLEKKPDSMKQEDYNLLDRQAMSKIRMTLAKNVLFNVKDIKTTKELLEALKDTYEKPSAMNKLWYAYAKTLAEKTAWEIAQQRGIDLVVVNPCFVVGPLLSTQPSSTVKILLHIIKGVNGGYPKRYAGFVDVEDAVAAHILAMVETRASGRLICCSSVAHWSQIISMLRAKYPDYPYESKGISQQDTEPGVPWFQESHSNVR